MNVEKENDIKDIQKLLKKINLKLWIMINSENSDKIFCKYISEKLTSLSMCFISINKVYILIHELDKHNIDSKYINKKNIAVIVYRTSNDLSEKIDDIISYLKFVSPISLSYSTMGDKDVDILGHGEFIGVTKILKKLYLKYKKRVRFNSAEKVIYSLFSTKTEKQIDRIKYIANITKEILETSFKTIVVGMTEIEIAKHIIDITKNITSKYVGNDITSVSLAWEICPIVLIGENLLKGGHTHPSEKVLLKGETIYVDFGICAKYEDGEKIYTDIQRMGYALKKNEIKPPKNVQNVFDTLVNSIEDALEYMKPDVKAYEIDEFVRGKILKAGYPNYSHSTGHSVGLNVHDFGAILAGKSSKRGRLSLVENGVYTLEPRIAVNNGGSIEEMILVTKFGGIPVCKMQKEIYLL